MLKWIEFTKIIQWKKNMILPKEILLLGKNDQTGHYVNHNKTFLVISRKLYTSNIRVSTFGLNDINLQIHIFHQN